MYTHNMKIHIAITTFERERELKKLIDDIQREKGDNEISIFVYDDHSQFNYRMVGLNGLEFLLIMENKDIGVL